MKPSDTTLPLDDSKIGPGALVLITGPSGAGKDTLISFAKNILEKDASCVFPQRIVTRPSTPYEDHISVSEWQFAEAASANQFSLWWAAHGHQYGIPRSIESEIRDGCAVVCNVSRSIVEHARIKFENVVVVSITAPAEILAARLSERGRSTDASVDARLSRSDLFREFHVDHLIENISSPEIGGQKLVEVLMHVRAAR